MFFFDATWSARDERLDLRLTPQDLPTIQSAAQATVRQDAAAAVQKLQSAAQDSQADVPERLNALDRQLRSVERESISAKLKYGELRDRPGAALTALDSAKREMEAADARLAETKRIYDEQAAELRMAVGRAWDNRYRWNATTVADSLRAKYAEESDAATAKVEKALAGVRQALADLVRLAIQREQCNDVVGPICGMAREQYLLTLFDASEMDRMKEELDRHIDPVTGRVIQPAKDHRTERYEPARIGH